MSATTTFFVDLFILLTCAVVAGEIANRLGQAALVGQLLVGVILGPSLLGPYLGLATLSPELSAIQFLGTVFILFMAGLYIVPEDVGRMGWSNALLGVAIFVIPFALTSAVAKLLFPGPSGVLPLFLGLTLSITALPVMGIMLAEFGVLESRIGRLLMNAALINELLAVSVFAVLLRLQAGGTDSYTAVAIAALSVGVFIGTMLSIHRALIALGRTSWWDGARQRAARSLRTKEAGIAILMICIVGASLFSQYIGLTFVVGAFYAGILVTRESAGTRAHQRISGIFDAITWGLFVPLFFAFVGIQMNLHEVDNVVTLAILGGLIAVALVTKVGTGYTVARAFGWSDVDARAIGHMVSSRGAVELAMAVILLSDGIFSSKIFTIVATVGLVTTIVAPIAAGRAFRARRPEPTAEWSPPVRAAEGLPTSPLPLSDYRGGGTAPAPGSPTAAPPSDLPPLPKGKSANRPSEPPRPPK